MLLLHSWLYFHAHVFNVLATTGNKNVVLMQLDLSDLDSVHKFCKEFNDSEDELHLLVNNAGK